MENLEDYIKTTRGCTHLNSDEKCRHATVNKLETYDWLENIQSPIESVDIIEVRFKYTRKDFFVNKTGEKFVSGDLIAVESSPGHDMGIVSLTGEIVYNQLRKLNIPLNADFKKVYRKAKDTDIEKWKKSIEREAELLLKSKEIVTALNIKMKIGDVELQGDGTKAIFYYTAEERVDFRELIKLLAENFRLRIEMKQIGARQESGRIGGLATCGRELCCISWKTNFTSVTTRAARLQELSLNPTRLAGQCGKLKCCLNYELDTYIDAKNDLPNTKIRLKTKEGLAYFQKSDVFKKIMWYTINPDKSYIIVPVPVERVEQIMKMNKKGVVPESLLQDKRDVGEMIRKKHNINAEKRDVLDDIDKSKDMLKKKIVRKNRPKKKKKKFKKDENRKQNNNAIKTPKNANNKIISVNNSKKKIAPAERPKKKFNKNKKIRKIQIIPKITKKDEEK